MKKKINKFKQIIINIWQGKLSLSRTFWLVFIIGGGILSLPSYLITDPVIDNASDLTNLVFILIFIFQYTYLIFAYVGVWRSASSYKPKKKQWPWGTITQVYIVLNVVRGVIKLFQ